MTRAPADVAVICARILAAAGYRALHPELVRSVVEAEAGKGRSPAETEKAARSRLHQVAGAWLPGRVDVERWVRELAETEGPEAQRELCRRLLAKHASSRERLPLLEKFFAPLLDATRPLVVLDLACGLNPLALPWMGLAAGSHLIACDAQTDVTAFLERALPLLAGATGVRSEVFAWNLLAGAPPVRADVALLLKTLPCLEQLDSGLPERLLRTIDAPLICVSFPVRSIGGRNKGMAASYGARFEALAHRLGRRATLVRSVDELVYRIERPAGSDQGGGGRVTHRR